MATCQCCSVGERVQVASWCLFHAGIINYYHSYGHIIWIQASLRFNLYYNITLKLTSWVLAPKIQTWRRANGGGWGRGFQVARCCFFHAGIIIYYHSYGYLIWIQASIRANLYYNIILKPTSWVLPLIIQLWGRADGGGWRRGVQNARCCFLHDSIIIHYNSYGNPFWIQASMRANLYYYIISKITS